MLGLPLKHTGKPTTAAITPADLMTRLYIYADDSLMGRQVGTVYNLRATAYIEREVRRLGLVPAGDGGGYFQDIPLYLNYNDSAASTLKIGGEALVVRQGFLPDPACRPHHHVRRRTGDLRGHERRLEHLADRRGSRRQGRRPHGARRREPRSRRHLQR